MLKASAEPAPYCKGQQHVRILLYMPQCQDTTVHAASTKSMQLLLSLLHTLAQSTKAPGCSQPACLMAGCMIRQAQKHNCTNHPCQMHTHPVALSSMHALQLTQHTRAPLPPFLRLQKLPALCAVICSQHYTPAWDTDTHKPTTHDTTHSLAIGM